MPRRYQPRRLLSVSHCETDSDQTLPYRHGVLFHTELIHGPQASIAEQCQGHLVTIRPVRGTMAKREDRVLFPSPALGWWGRAPPYLVCVDTFALWE